LAVPLDKQCEASAKALVHRAPFFAVFTSVAPVLRLPHTVPLEVDINTSILAMCDIAGSQLFHEPLAIPPYLEVKHGLGVIL
jgi:hypothetical protein